MIIADTCLVVHLFNETELTEKAQEILAIDPEWILPTLWREEYANVLSKKARKEQKESSEVIEFLTFTINELKHCEHHVEIQKALQISIEKKISVYDAHFVALAERFESLLITEDQEVIKKRPAIAMRMEDFILHHKTKKSRVISRKNTQ